MIYFTQGYFTWYLLLLSVGDKSVIQVKKENIDWFVYTSSRRRVKILVVTYISHIVYKITDLLTHLQSRSTNKRLIDMRKAMLQNANKSQVKILSIPSFKAARKGKWRLTSCERFCYGFRMIWWKKCVELPTAKKQKRW